MPGAKAALFIFLTVVGIGFLAVWTRALIAARRAGAAAAQDPVTDVRRPTAYQLLVGFVTDFLDTLGIGSFATTTTLFRLRRAIDDRLIPGTLNVGHTLPTFAQAYIYITIVQVEMATLALMIAASVAGAWLGSGVVAGWPKRNVQVGMGIALLAASLLILARLLEVLPQGGDDLGLSGGLLVAGLVGNFILGALMTVGIGAYAPIMIMVALLGMSPKTAFPIMMGSCAFLMPVASARFIRKGGYDLRASLGLTLGGIPAVLLAAFIVKELPLDVVRWLVVAVVVYTAISMLRSASREPTEGTA